MFPTSASAASAEPIKFDVLGFFQQKLPLNTLINPKTFLELQKEQYQALLKEEERHCEALVGGVESFDIKRVRLKDYCRDLLHKRCQDLRGKILQISASSDSIFWQDFFEDIMRLAFFAESILPEFVKWYMECVGFLFVTDFMGKLTEIGVDSDRFEQEVLPFILDCLFARTIFNLVKIEDYIAKVKALAQVNKAEFVKAGPTVGWGFLIKQVRSSAGLLIKGAKSERDRQNFKDYCDALRICFSIETSLPKSEGLSENKKNCFEIINQLQEMIREIAADRSFRQRKPELERRVELIEKLYGLLNEVMQNVEKRLAMRSSQQPSTADDVSEALDKDDENRVHFCLADLKRSVLLINWYGEIGEGGARFDAAYKMCKRRTKQLKGIKVEKEEDENLLGFFDQLKRLMTESRAEDTGTFCVLRTTFEIKAFQDLYRLCVEQKDLTQLKEYLKYQNEFGIVEALLDVKGNTVLHALCLRAEETPELIEAVRFLSSLTVDLNKKNKAGQIAFECACVAGKWQLAQLLKPKEMLEEVRIGVEKIIVQKYQDCIASVDSNIAVLNNILELGILSPAYLATMISIHFDSALANEKLKNVVERLSAVLRYVVTQTKALAVDLNDFYQSIQKSSHRNKAELLKLLEQYHRDLKLPLNVPAKKISFIAACQQGSVKQVQSMLMRVSEAKKYFREKDENGNRGFHLACMMGNLPLVKCLLDRAACAQCSNMLSDVNNDGHTALNLLLTYRPPGWQDILTLLLNDQNFDWDKESGRSHVDFANQDLPAEIIERLQARLSGKKPTVAGPAEVCEMPVIAAMAPTTTIASVTVVSVEAVTAAVTMASSPESFDDDSFQTVKRKSKGDQLSPTKSQPETKRQARNSRQAVNKATTPIKHASVAAALSVHSTVVTAQKTKTLSVKTAPATPIPAPTQAVKLPAKQAWSVSKAAADQSAAPATVSNPLARLGVTDGDSLFSSPSAPFLFARGTVQKNVDAGQCKVSGSTYQLFAGPSPRA